MGGQTQQDRACMERCLALADAAGRRGEVPVGAVVVVDERVVGEGSNRCEELASPLAHAELEALGEAFAAVGRGRLPDATVYCSLEPCFMCAGALSHARVRRVVFAARDPKFGACASLARVLTDPRLNHRATVEEGLMAEASADLLRRFFSRLR